MTGCLADYEGLDRDTAAELALAIDEACTVLIGIASGRATLVLVEDPRARELVVRVSTDCDVIANDPDCVVLSGFSRRVLESLTEKVETFIDRPTLGISLTIRRHGASARRQ